jgi:signal transduction histidine kinase
MTTTNPLRAVPLLVDAPDALLGELAARSRELTLPAGAAICREGEVSVTMFVILAGAVQAQRTGDDGEPVLLTVLYPGDLVGELALLDNAPRSATVIALEPTRLLAVEQSVFLELLESSPGLIRGVLAKLANKLRERIGQNYERELARRRIETQAELDRYRSLSQMVAGVAHELNTPLGIANTAAGIIANRLNDPAVSAALRADRQMANLLEDILDARELLTRNVARAHTLVQSFKKISVGQVADVLGPTPLPAAVADVLELFRMNARRAKLVFDVQNELPPDTPPWQGYAGLLSQVLLNLLTNIERYAYPNNTGGRVVIRLSAVAEVPRPTYTIMVQDFGRGMNAETLRRLFEPFFTTGRITGGTGLGMAIVYNLVTEALGGKIAVESAENVGTTVLLTLPDLVKA